MVSAICPLCHILLVEANSPANTDLGTAVNAAVALGAKFVSNSYGGPTTRRPTPPYDADYYDHPGVAVTASAGDNGYGVEYPAPRSTSPPSAAPRCRPPRTHAAGRRRPGRGTGSGCSAFEAKPSCADRHRCRSRTDDDVSAVADPATGVAVYDTYSAGGWAVSAAPAWRPRSSPPPTRWPASRPRTTSRVLPLGHPFSLYDVTSGSDGTCNPAYLCTAQAGYDGPTGWAPRTGRRRSSPGRSGHRGWAKSGRRPRGGLPPGQRPRSRRGPRTGWTCSSGVPTTRSGTSGGTAWAGAAGSRRATLACRSRPARRRSPGETTTLTCSRSAPTATSTRRPGTMPGATRCLPCPRLRASRRDRPRRSPHGPRTGWTCSSGARTTPSGTSGGTASPGAAGGRWARDRVQPGGGLLGLQPH